MAQKTNKTNANEVNVTIANTNQTMALQNSNNINQVIANQIQNIYNQNALSKQSALAQSINYSFSLKYNQWYYASLPAAVYDYENRIIRPLANLHDGYLSTIHNTQQGVFSTNLAASLVSGISNSIWRAYKGFKYDGKNDTQTVLKTMEKWAKIARFTTEWKKAITYATMLGTAALKVNYIDGIPTITAFRKEYFYSNVQTSNKTKIIDAKFVLDTFINSVPNSPDEIYYVVEHRYFEREINILANTSKLIPMVNFYVCRSGGNITTAQSYPVDKEKALNLEDIPQNIKENLSYEIVENYNKPKQLPIEFGSYLGCELLMYDGFDSTMPGTPYGKSILLNIFSYIIFWELNRSFSIRDQYAGKSVVYMPANLLDRNKSAVANNGMEDFLVKSVDGLDKIEVVQFAIRAEEWNAAKNSILECIAININCSPSTIASFLHNRSGNVTATEIEYEQSATNQLVYTQIINFNDTINSLLNVVAKLLGIDGDVEIKYKEPGSNIPPLTATEAIQAKQSGVIAHNELLKILFPGKEEFELEKMMSEAKEDFKQNSFGQSPFDNQNYLGDENAQR